MKKELITVFNLDAHICKEDGKCYVGPNMIIAPGAKDELAKRRVRIEYKAMPQPEASCAECCAAAAPAAAADSKNAPTGKYLEEIAIAVAALIKKECGIEDPEKLRELTIQALKSMPKVQ